MTNEDWLVFGALGGSLVLLIAAAWGAGAHGPTSWAQTMGPLNYDFSKSWASSITVLGALLGTILGAKGVVPDHPHYLPASVYSALNLLFGILVVLAPFVYRATSRPQRVTSPQGTDDTQYQGFVFGFLLATLLTVWGVVGQVATILLLFGELQQSQGVFVVFVGLVGASGLLLVFYVVTSVGAILTYQQNTDVHARALQVQMALLNVDPPKTVTPPHPQWSLL